jgi:DNA-binding SARP family transcriptional activator/tetratricopeptide (TPR) repeat protein
MDNPKLRILLLGPPAVYLGEKPVDIPRKIVRALLFFLAGEHTFVSRNRIINTFWPEENETDARRHLREILSKLRNALPLQDALLTIQDQVSLDFQQIYIDAFDFSETITRNSSFLKPSRSRALDSILFKEMERVIFLWRSPRFMAGFNSPNCMGFEIWARKTGSLLESYRRQVMKILAKDTASRGDLISSLWWLHQAIQEDEFETELQFLYMDTLHQLGRSREALDYFDDLQDFYKEEGLGEIPITIRELEKRIRTAHTNPNQSRSISWPGMVDLSTPFIGRQRILDEIKHTFSQGGSVIIKGEAGLGKSRLAFELFHQIDPPPILFFAQGRSHESDLPFQTIIDCLRHAITSQELKKLNPLHRGYLARLIPELNVMETVKDPSYLPPGEKGRAAIFEACHQILLGLSRDKRVIFFVDDAHWCDRSSLDAFAYLHQQGFFCEHGLLLLAARVEENVTLFNDFPRNSKHPDSIQAYFLERFGYSEVSQLVDTVMGFAPSGELVQRLMLDSGGNPLILIETLNTLHELGFDADQVNAVQNLPLTNNIRVLIHNRLKQVSDQARDLLITAAIIGNSFPIPVLEKASPMKKVDFVSAIEQLERIHLIHPLAEEPSISRYSFIHDKIRESLLAEVSPIRLNLVHEHVATALEETRPTSQQAAVIADHFQSAGNIHRAFHYWIEAGIYAQYMLSPHEASQAFRNAEKLFLQMDILMDINEIHKLYVNWAGLMEERNDSAGWKECFDKLIEWGRKRQSPLLTGSGFNGLAHIEIQKINPHKAMEYIREAEIYLSQVDHKVELSKLLNHKGIIYQMTSELDKAAESYQKSVSLTKGLLDPWVQHSRGNLLTRSAVLEAYLCHTQNALRISDENILLGEQTGNHLTACWGYLTKSVAQNLAADCENGGQSAETGLRIASSIQNHHQQAYLYCALGKNELELGKLKEGWEHIQRSISLSREFKHLEVLSQAFEELSELYVCLWDYRKASEVASAGIACHRNQFQMYWNMLMYGFTRLHLGDIKGGEEKIIQVLEITRASGLNYIYYPAMVCEAYLNIAKGNLDIARNSLDQVIELCEPCEMHFQICLSYWMLGLISLKEGDSEKSLDSVGKAISIARAIRNPWLEINSLQMNVSILKEKNRDSSSQRKRIDELLAQISAGGIPEELNENYKNYLNQVILD